MATDDFFMGMCREAQEEIAKGRKGWKEVDTNTLVLACFGMLYNHLASKLSKPLWWFAGAVTCGVIGYIITLILSAP